MGCGQGCWSAYREVGVGGCLYLCLCVCPRMYVKNVLGLFTALTVSLVKEPLVKLLMHECKKFDFKNASQLKCPLFGLDIELLVVKPEATIKPLPAPGK